MNNYSGRICTSDFEKNAYKLPISLGCSYNACYFCDLFKDLSFRTLNIDDIKNEILRVKNIGGNPKIIFFGDGNAFHNDTKRLIYIMNLCKDSFNEDIKFHMDASITDIKSKSDDELFELFKAGIDLLYIGVECAEDDVLKFINKDYKTTDEAIIEIDRLHNVNINYSAHMMTGICGHNRGQQNAIKLAKFYDDTKPLSITNFSLFIIKDLPLYNKVQSGEFIPASEIENLYESKTLIENIKNEVMIDCFHDNIPFRVRGFCVKDKKMLIDKIDLQIEKLEKEFNIK